MLLTFNLQAQKFRAASDTEDNELEEESLLESPLEKIEPYGLFRDALIRKLPAFASSKPFPPPKYPSLTINPAPSRTPTRTTWTLRKSHQEFDPRGTGHHSGRR